MIITFASSRLEEECNDERLLVRRHGAQRAKLLKHRLVKLRAASNLGIFPPYRKPERCHELKNNRKGQLSVDLDQPYRLIFRPLNNPLPVLPDGGLDWARITAVEILGIEDTHD